jgi:hypothetical protein
MSAITRTIEDSLGGLHSEFRALNPRVNTFYLTLERESVSIHVCQDSINSIIFLKVFLPLPKHEEKHWY